MKVSTADVTRKTGAEVDSGLASWTTREDGEIVEHLAGVDKNGHLLEFTWRPSSDWQVNDISDEVGMTFHQTRPAAWVSTRSVRKTESLALPDEHGNLIVIRKHRVTIFFGRRRVDGWKAQNISSMTGTKINKLSAVCALNVPSSRSLRGSEFLYATNPSGLVTEFSFERQEGWEATTVPGLGNRDLKLIPCGLTAWNKRTSRGTVITVAGISFHGDLLEATRRVRGTWDVEKVDAEGNRFSLKQAVSWKAENVEHLACVSRSNDLVLYWRRFSSSAGGWRRANPSGETSQKVDYVDDAFTLTAQEAGSDEPIQCLTARFNKNVLRFWWNRKHWWQVQDITQATGIGSDEAVPGWTVPNGAHHVEHTAHVDNGKVVVTWGLRSGRVITEKISRGRGGMAFDRKRRRDACVIPYRFKGITRQNPIYSRNFIDRKTFGSREDQSAADYFRIVSRGAFTMGRAGVFPWVESEFDECWYYNRDGCSSQGDEADEAEKNWGNRHHRKYMEAIRDSAENTHIAQQFSALDDDGDQILTPDELGIIIAVDRPGRGFVRTAKLKEPDNTRSNDEPLVLNGIRFGRIAEWYAGDNRIDVPTLVHELLHLFCNFPDLYQDKLGRNYGYDLHGYDIMDTRFDQQGPVFSHPSGVLKLMLGWVRPHIPLRTATYNLPAVADSGRVIVLPREGVEDEEFFLIENRQIRPYDNIVSEGLAIYHYVGTDDRKIRPHDVTQDEWNDVLEVGGWRTRLRMIRPDRDGGGNAALWRANSPGHGYDLVSHRVQNSHAALEWADGTQSGYSIREISASGANMSMKIGVPQ